METENLIPIILDVWRRTGKVSRMQTVGDSMSPLIEFNSLLQVLHCEPQGLKAGDIVVIEQGGKLIVHRLVYRKLVGDNVFWAEKGDNSCWLKFVPINSIVGRVSQISNPKGDHWKEGSLQRRINRLIGMYWRLVVPMCFLRQKIDAGEWIERGEPTYCRIESRLFNLDYIPRLLTKLYGFKTGRS